MNDIDNFWMLDHSKMGKDELMEKAREHYREDFIDSYSKWSANIRAFNASILEALVQSGFRRELYEEMSYDWFCKNVIDMICEWINVNGTISGPDITVITQRLTSDYCAIQAKKHNDSLYTVGSVMASIKRVKML